MNKRIYYREGKAVVSAAFADAELTEVTVSGPEGELRPGDMILMCTDGLTNMLEDEEIRMIISGGRDIVDKAQRLVTAANNNGGRDNISVMLIQPFADNEANR